MFCMKWVVLWSLWATSLVRQPTMPVRVSGGWVRGEVVRDGSHVRYLSLPYASTDYESRFQAPGPDPKWKGVFDAFHENIGCKRLLGPIVIGQVNCLTLNVYTSVNARPEDQRPVMVFFHGGGFFTGSAQHLIYGPNYLVSKGVILVAANYRLNILGFACLGIREAPGNAALKDQVAALKWVQRNIAAFGGNPNNVTIFGESAGGASVSYHVISPMSKGLFHKAILQSGSSLAPWALQFTPLNTASLLAKSLGFETDDPHELYKIFMDKTDEELILAKVPREKGSTIFSEVLHVPCVERTLDGIDPFLTEEPYDILTEGRYNKVPMIIGSNSQEGYLFVALETIKDLKEINFEKALPVNLVFPTETINRKIADEISKLYMGNEIISKDTMLNLSKFYGELNFIYPIEEESSLIINTNNNPVFSYIFNYDGWRNFAKMFCGSPMRFASGATHVDELFYIFKQTLLPNLFEDKMINRMTTMWTNFAKYGDPTPDISELIPVKWPRADRSSPQSLVINDELSTVPLWHSKSLRFWRDVYSEYRRRY